MDENKKQQVITFFVLGILLILSFMAFSKVKSITGFAVFDNADVIAGQDSYYAGDMAHIFIFPASADYEVKVYGPDGNLYASALNFPVEKPGTYTVAAILTLGNETKTVSTEFEAIEPEPEEETDIEEEITEIINDSAVPDTINLTIEKIEENKTDVSLLNAAPAVNESTPINISVTEMKTSSAAGDVISSGVKVAEDIGDNVEDEEGKTVGKKVDDEQSYETFFLFAGKEGDDFKLSFYHNNTEGLIIWIEGSAGENISSGFAEPNETVNITVPLADGKIPRFKLHVGPDSDVFEFGITVINLQSYPVVGGNWTVRFTTEGEADLIITPINGTQFGVDLEFLELRCGNNILNAQYNSSTVYYPSYSCAVEGAETSSVITGGRHHLMFEFGDDRAFANNYAESTVCPDGCTYNNITGCLIGINNTDAGCILNQSNYVYAINASHHFNITTTAMNPVIMINATNITLDCNNSLIEGSGTGTGIYFEKLSNITVKRCSIWNYTVGINISNGKESLILNNSLNNMRNVSMWIHANRTRIINNTIDRSGGGDAGYDLSLAILYSSINNTIKGNILNNSNPWGIVVAGTGKGPAQNNTIVNNTVIRSPNGITVGAQAKNNTIVNNTVKNSNSYGIYIYETQTLDSDNNYIVGNSVYDSGIYDLYINTALNENNTVVLNNFYSLGVSNNGTGSLFCQNNEGNFYISTLNKSYIEQVLEDCGPVNITYPNASSMFESEAEIRINWTNQSSYSNITYHVYYSIDAGFAWIFSGSTNETNYTINISPFPNTKDFALRVTPFDGISNGTFGNVTGIRFGPDNQWICLNQSLCEYQNITGAFVNENNTPNNITLIDSNAAYNADNTGRFNISVDSGDEGAIIINGTNITVDCLDTELVGNLAGYGIYAAGWNNLTIKNCRLSRYYVALNISSSLYDVFSNIKLHQNNFYSIYAFNVTNSSFSGINSSDNSEASMFLRNSSNNTISNSRFFNNTAGGGLTLNDSSYNIIDSVNASSNRGNLLYLSNNSHNNLIKHSRFENTSNNGVVILSDNNTFFNNTVKKARTSSLAGLSLMGEVINAQGRYNNISNNTFENIEIPIIAASYGNIIQNNLINGSYTVAYGAISIMGALARNNTVINNQINNSQGTGIYSGFYAAGYGSRSNITRNIIENSALADSGYYALYINSSSNNTNVWNNSFYSGGVLNNGTGSSFCVENEGNFYEENTASSRIPSDDCGPVNITEPDGQRSYKGIIQINWTKQSSPRNVSYNLYYSNNSGTNWSFIASTSNTNYSWDTTWLENYSLSTFLVRVIPYDDYYNATTDNSTTTFNITVNNNWVCSNSSYCEYTDITSAFAGQDNDPNVITLMDGNTLYQAAGSATYNISPPSGGAAVNISKSNVTLDCNNAVLASSGNGYGLYASGHENLTILNCNFYNYTYGLLMISSSFSRIANTTINSSKQSGLNLSDVNKSTLEYSSVFASVTGNVILENSYNNTIKYSNFTNSSEYGVYLASSGLNRFYSINSSANNFENMYIDIASMNNSIVNSTFSNSSRHNVFIAGDRSNLSKSTFSNISSGNYDIRINGSATATAVWLNNFFSQGVNDSGTGSIFCINNTGNFYNPNISSDLRVTGTCGNLSEPYADKDKDGYFTLDDCNDNSAAIFPGAEEFCDDADNDCDGSVDEGGVCAAETFPSAGTGGVSGGGGFKFTKYKTVNIQEEPVFSMATFEEVVFSVRGVEHTLKLYKVYEDSVNASVFSDEINFILAVDEAKDIDLDKDSLFDVNIKLTEIKDARASFRMHELEPRKEEIPGTKEEPEEKPAGKIKEKPKEEKPAKMPSLAKKLRKINKKPFIIGIIFLIVIGALSGSFMYYKSVVEGIRPMEDFIDSAVEKGCSKSKIRKELIEAGWDEAIIDSVLDFHKKVPIKKELKNYIQNALRQGFTKEQITALLEKRGWPKEGIRKLLK